MINRAYAEKLKIGTTKCDLLNGNINAETSITSDNLSLSGTIISLSSGDNILRNSNSTNALEADDEGEQVGLFGVGPTAQGTTSNLQTVEFAAGSSTISNDTATWGGYTLGQIFQAAALAGALDLYGSADTMVMVVDTSLAGGDDMTVFPAGTVDVIIDWGDGNTDTATTAGAVNHTYTSGGIYRIKITGTMTNYAIPTGGSSANNAKITRVEKINSTTVSFQLPSINNNTFFINDLNNVTNMDAAFIGLFTFGSAGIEDLDTQNITSMNSTLTVGLFWNGDVSGWDVSNVTDMGQMFLVNANFNQNIGSWDVSSVTNMDRMLSGCGDFDQDLGSWNTSSCLNMFQMFFNCDVFNQDIGSWDVSNVTDMGGMFGNCAVFNQNIGNWYVGNVTDMGGMFFNCDAFNQDIGGWNVGKVKNFNTMFEQATSFNQDIGSWNVGNATTMNGMFSSASGFNQDIGSWNVSNVTDMEEMFDAATSFDQDLSAWRINRVTDFTDFMTDVTLSTANYDALLIGWASRRNGVPVEGNLPAYTTPLSIDFGSSTYTGAGAGGTARQELVDYGWTISDGGAV